MTTMVRDDGRFFARDGSAIEVHLHLMTHAFALINRTSPDCHATQPYIMVLSCYETPFLAAVRQPLRTNTYHCRHRHRHCRQFPLEHQLILHWTSLHGSWHILQRRTQHLSSVLSVSYAIIQRTKVSSSKQINACFMRFPLCELALMDFARCNER